MLINDVHFLSETFIDVIYTVWQQGPNILGRHWAISWSQSHEVHSKFVKFEYRLHSCNIIYIAVIFCMYLDIWKSRITRKLLFCTASLLADHGIQSAGMHTDGCHSSEGNCGSVWRGYGRLRVTTCNYWKKTVNNYFLSTCLMDNDNKKRDWIYTYWMYVRTLKAIY
jgi:hypothetical protein